MICTPGEVGHETQRRGEVVNGGVVVAAIPFCQPLAMQNCGLVLGELDLLDGGLR